MKQSIHCLITVLLLPVLILLNCTDPSGIATPDTNESQVIGYVYMVNGTSLIPAKNASVTIILATSRPDSVIGVEVVADEYGCYKVLKNQLLPLGTYNVLAEKETQKGYEKQALSIIDTVSCDTVSPIILDAPGSLTGVVRLQPQHDNEDAIILLMGTHYYCKPDSNGVFTLDSLAPGEYSAHIIAEPSGYTPFDATFKIRADISDTLKDTISLVYDLAQPVTGFKIYYDHACMVSRLSWNRPASNRVLGYNVYRCFEGPMTQNKIANGIHDTFFVDDMLQYEDSTFIYAVTAVDTNWNETKYSSIIKVTVSGKLYISNCIKVANGPNNFWRDVYFDALSQRIYAVINNKIIRCNQDGSNLKSFGTDTSDTTGPFRCPMVIRVDKNQNVYVLNFSFDLLQPTTPFIVKLDSSFNIISHIPLSVNTFNWNFDFNVTPDGAIFTVQGNGIITPQEKRASRICKYDSSGALLKIMEIGAFMSGMQISENKIIIAGDMIRWLTFELIQKDSMNIAELIPDDIKPFMNNNYYKFISLFNGYSSIMRDEVIITSPEKEVLARQLLKYPITINESLDIFLVKNENLYTYRIKP